MILALRNGLAEHLAARHFPVTVALGDERPAPRGAPRHAHRVLLERDAAGDEIRAPVGCSSNPRRVYARFVGYVATVYAAASKPGALAVEHAIECDRIVDGVLVALHDWSKANGAIVEIVAGRMLAPDEMQGAEVRSQNAVGLFRKRRVFVACAQAGFDMADGYFVVEGA